MSEAVRRLARITTDMNKALRYGTLWDEFTPKQHVDYAIYKATRAMVLHKQGDARAPDAYDDLIDACNALRFAADLLVPWVEVPLLNDLKEEFKKMIVKEDEEYEQRGTEEGPTGLATGTDEPRCPVCYRLWKHCQQHRKADLGRPAGDTGGVREGEQGDKHLDSTQRDSEERDTPSTSDSGPDKGIPLPDSRWQAHGVD